uniref:Uncharacterized protein n=1 Tax=Anguilla anguilla TaxID=7936 RepID=A0A0E9QPI1_ANGAN
MARLCCLCESLTAQSAKIATAGTEVIHFPGYSCPGWLIN